MINYIIPFCVFLIFGCQSQTSKTEATISNNQLVKSENEFTEITNSNVLDKTKTDREIELRSEKNNGSVKKSLQEFEVYWKAFREAVINEDSLTLTNMTKLPLIVEGNYDEDPIIKIKADKFNKVFKAFLLNEDDLDDRFLKFKNHFGYIKATKNIISDNNFNELGDPSNAYNPVRVGNMEFEKVGSVWKLEQIYLDTKEIKY